MSLVSLHHGLPRRQAVHAQEPSRHTNNPSSHNRNPTLRLPVPYVTAVSQTAPLLGTRYDRSPTSCHRLPGKTAPHTKPHSKIIAKVKRQSQIPPYIIAKEKRQSQYISQHQNQYISPKVKRGCNYGEGNIQQTRDLQNQINDTVFT